MTEIKNSRVKGRVVEGHRVASGANQNPLFPGGTLRMQQPYFNKLGLDLSSYHLATVNLSVAPSDFTILEPNWHFKAVSWHPTEPAEDFSLVKISVGMDERSTSSKGLVYFPHPETKPAHYQPPGLIELILETFIPGIDYGDELWLTYPVDRLNITGSSSLES